MHGIISFILWSDLCVPTLLVCPPISNIQDISYFLPEKSICSRFKALDGATDVCMGRIPLVFTVILNNGQLLRHFLVTPNIYLAMYVGNLDIYVLIIMLSCIIFFVFCQLVL